MKKIIQYLYKNKVLPITTIDDPEKAVTLSRMLFENKLPLVEVLFQTDAAAESIRRIRQTFPEMVIGAGTILNPAQALTARNAGADFVVAPGFNPKTVDFCRTNHIPIIPGVDSPSLIEAALEKGIYLVKFYPAQASGGIDYLKAVAGPYKKIRLMPVGGIDPNNISDYLSYEKVVGCGASWMTSSELIFSSNFKEIHHRINRMRALLKKNNS